eukprot:4465643-Pyramimonas_sp.AAC.1
MSVVEAVVALVVVVDVVAGTVTIAGAVVIVVALVAVIARDAVVVVGRVVVVVVAIVVGRNGRRHRSRSKDRITDRSTIGCGTRLRRSIRGAL